jgi:hypothetical protein
MRSVALGSVVTLILITGFFVSQVEAKNHENDDKGKNQHIVPNHVVPNHVRHNDTRSVPIPGTLLALGGGLVGLVAWRARQRKPRD